MKDEVVSTGALFVVGTPIGNMGDMTFRAVEILKNVDGVLCEDTRITKRLLHYYNIDTPAKTYHQHSSEKVVESIIKKLDEGLNMALVTDAGTPGLSDPGNALVERIVAEGNHVIPIPGVSAVTALVSVAGVDMQRFSFLGFVPHKKGRQTFFDRVVASDIPVMYYDSVHRVVKNLELLVEKDGDIHVIVGRELTKLFEEVVRGSATDVFEYFRSHPEKVKGEFVVTVHRK